MARKRYVDKYKSPTDYQLVLCQKVTWYGVTTSTKYKLRDGACRKCVHKFRCWAVKGTDRQLTIIKIGLGLKEVYYE